MCLVSFASSLGLSNISLSTCVASCLLIYPCTFGVCWSSALCWCESGSSRLVHRHPSIHHMVSFRGGSRGRDASQKSEDEGDIAR